MPRVSPDVLRRALRGLEPEEPMPEEAPLPGEEEPTPAEEAEVITDPDEWRAKVAEIVAECRSRIEAITPPELMDRIDEEITAALAARTPREETPAEE